MSREYDEHCMKAAIEEADLASKEGKMPFGSVLADRDGKILCRAHNGCEQAARRGGGTGDVTRHAEMELIRKFTAELSGDRGQWTLYTSTEPCVMCAGAIYWSGVGRVVYGCSAAQLEELSGPGGFDIAVERLYGMASEGARRIEVEGPLLADESLRVHDESGVWKNPWKERKTQAEEDIAMERSLKETGLGSASVKDDNVVPTIDLSAGTDEEIRRKIWEAATQVGFFTVTGHGIDQRIIDDAFAVAADFFAQPVDIKTKQSPLDMSINCGFEHFAQVRPSTGVADQKESLQVTAREGAMEGRWPSDDYKEKTHALMNAANALAGRLLNLLEPLATPQVEPGTLASSHTLWSDDGQCTLRFLHYPAMEKEKTARLLESGYWRAGPQ
jgi:tRNA(Arg) A34 adenosine deaminase TadA